MERVIEPKPNLQRASVLVLASRSPRRRQMLEDAGIPHVAIDPGVDDGLLDPVDADPASWVAALAFLKASAGQESLDPRARAESHVLGGDTVCVSASGEILGQPETREHAIETLASLAQAPHDVLSGCAILPPSDEPASRRIIFTSRATVRFKGVTSRDIETYAVSDAWKGKAGGYNLEERIADGWRISVDGDPGVVVGLPMIALTPVLRSITSPQPQKGSA